MSEAVNQTPSPLRGLQSKRVRTAAIAVFAAVLIVACPVMSGIVTDEEAEDSEAIAPLLVLAIGIVIGAWAYDSIGDAIDGSVFGSGTVSGSSDDSVAAALRESSAALVSSNYSTASGMWTNMARISAQQWSFMETYFDRMAEVAAAAMWSADSDYDGDRILISSSYIENAAVYSYNVAATWNQFTESWSDYRDLWAAEEGYESMTVAFVTDTGSWTSDGVFGSELMRYVTPTSTSNMVYLNVVSEDSDGYTDRANLMYCTGAGTLTSVATGTTYNVSEGENDLSDLASGWYELGAGTTYISINLAASVSQNGLMPGACMLLRNGTDWAYVYESGENYVIVEDGTSATTATLGLSVSYDDADGTTVTYATVDLTRVISAYADISDALNSAAVSTDHAGETAWRVYDNLETSSTLISPSSITAGTQTGTTMSTALASAMYIAALQQIAELGGNATSENVTISGDSLNLYCYGDIYVDGVLVAEDAVYTPFVYNDATIAVGTTDLDVSGIAAIWATGVSSLEDWDHNTGGGGIVSISGATLDTRNIISDGVEVSSITLDVASMEYLGLVDYDVPDPTPTPATADAVLLLQIIIVLAAAVIAVAGWFSGHRWLMLIALVLAIVGITMADEIADLIW